MLALLLSILLLILTWGVAHLLAVPAAYLVRQTGLSASPVLGWFRPNGELPRAKTLRKLFFGINLAGLTLLMAAMLNIQPVYSSWTSYISNFVNSEVARSLMPGLLDNLVLTLGIFVIYHVISFVNQLFPRIFALLDKWRYTRFHVIHFKNLELFTPDQITDALISSARYFQISLNIILALGGLTYVLSFFPGTQDVTHALLSKFFEIIQGVGQTALGFLPNLLTLLTIAIATRYLLKILRFFHEGINRNRIKIAGLHPDLAEPTYQLLRFLVVALALVIAYPFLPGSDSPVFRGITIFVGFLLSLGSTALVTNIVSGVVLTYTRGLRIGDRVKIGDTVGDVIERTLLVTRLRTIKNVVISIPNSMVLNNEIINYSAHSKEGLILNTTVTIGYDVPWREVHQLLIRAALATGDIQPTPRPFVLQTSLDDYYVSYELNAYTSAPERMAVIYSNLHQNIQDSFHAAGVEIMSPAYTAYRDGSQAAIPAFSGRLEPAAATVFNAFMGVETRPVGAHSARRGKRD